MRSFLRVCAFGIVIALLPARSGVSQGMPQVSVDTLHRGEDNEAIVRITNGTSRAFKLVMVQCTFLNGDRAIDTQSQVALNVAAGETVFEKVRTDKQLVETVRCRVTSTTP